MSDTVQSFIYCGDNANQMNIDTSRPHYHFGMWEVNPSETKKTIPIITDRVISYIRDPANASTFPLDNSGNIASMGHNQYKGYQPATTLPTFGQIQIDSTLQDANSKLIFWFDSGSSYYFREKVGNIYKQDVKNKYLCGSLALISGNNAISKIVPCFLHQIFNQCILPNYGEATEVLKHSKYISEGTLFSFARALRMQYGSRVVNEGGKNGQYSMSSDPFPQYLLPGAMALVDKISQANYMLIKQKNKEIEAIKAQLEYPKANNEHSVQSGGDIEL